MKTLCQCLFATLCCLLAVQTLSAQSSSGTKPELLMNRYNSQGAPPARITVNPGDTLGWLRWRGFSTGPAYISSAEIRAYVSGAPTATYIPSNLVFKNGPTMADRMIILDNGNIGVGTSAPAHLFDVNGDARVAQRFRLGANSKTALLDENDSLVINPDNVFLNDVVVDSDLKVNGALKVNDLEILNDLKVGRDAIIGRDLSVGRNGTVTQDFTIGDDLVVQDDAQIQGRMNVQGEFETSQNAIIGNNATVNNQLTVHKDIVANSDIYVNHRVAIGAGSYYYLNNPNQYSLMVDGGVICESVRVALNGTWPDYVFADNYPLKPIAELEHYIQENKHLPNVPAANEINKEGGFDLGDMNRKLLEKVEELTLYLIQQQKEIETLKTQINQLQK